jgi:predicted CXXCH cytochrome family protein
MHKPGYIPALVLAVLLPLPCLWAVQKPTEPTESCITRECHNSYLQKRFVHKPVTLGVCKFCHQSVDPKQHSFKLFRTRKELCGICHQEQTRDMKLIPSMEQLRPKAHIGSGKYLHEPLEKGQCTDCHNPHGSDYKFFLPVGAVEELCRKCHEKKEDVRYPHEPVADGKCILCHDSHSSSYQALLINNERQLCFSCHEDIKAELEGAKYIHKPVIDLECGVCHKPHGSDYFKLLVKEYPSEFYAPFDISNYDLCFSCHREGIVLVEETENSTNFRNGSKNLHYLHVNLPKKGRTCGTCHATHASNEPRHLGNRIPYGGWEIPIQFQKTGTGGSCSPGCHDPRNYDRINPVSYVSDKTH